ncbi:6-phospho-beta-glucosidase [Actinoplanes teichomyceticus]|uniref:6-phospho-beta-glucosidase n=1 Tax=Actinoplanes teichomyceticus TaxID=1867 RepID=A0A561WA23_ACTTI|nr:6-phospho-beta-glucosidase [Actinoplanes teichomyceticus]TWG20706.1 6-phospho-beta-glucosidase [Actinoplanes teichomyceticus]GIF14362.1 6-phospho-beta-glucosidase [Actinoplanes teichomyceticus]
MRLTILGGGGFRVPLVYRALLADHRHTGITEVVLQDVDRARLDGIGRVLAALARDAPAAPAVVTTTDLDEALTGATFVFSAIRVGGLRGRVVDEHVALAAGVLGQETVGAGGIAYGLRSVPEAMRIAERTARLAPEAWLINFTNPAGLVTEAMSRTLGDRVIGICDSPTGMVDRVLRVLGVRPEDARVDYAGLNHLGWLYGVHAGGRDLLPGLLADDQRLRTIEEGRLFGNLRELGAIPNEYLHYYYDPAGTLEAVRGAAQTRGAFLRAQQERGYHEIATRDPLQAWLDAWREREATYMAENRELTGAGEREHDESRPAGYEGVALAVMRALARDEPATLILDVRNRGTLDVLDDDAVVEVPCRVDARGAVPLPVAPMPGHAVELVRAVKATDRLVLEAATTGSRDAAVRAMATHPLVADRAVAERLVDAYRAQLPELSYLV